MKATFQFVKTAFDRFNKLCFEGILPVIPIQMMESRSYLGKVTYKVRRDFFGVPVAYEDFGLKVSSAFDLPVNELEDVVIHEMIHYYIAWRGIADTSSHGDAYKRIMDTINLKYGRHITISHRITEGELEQEIRANHICVSQLQDGNWGVTVCAKTKIFEIHRNLPKYYHLQSMAWYGSIDPFFNKYPRSKTPKIYKVTKTELDEHLADAVLLECDGHVIRPV